MICPNPFFICCIFTILFASCESKFERQRKEGDAIIEKQSKFLSEKYTAIILDDSLCKYAFSYQEEFVEKNRLITFKANISDIFKVDTSYVLSAYSTINFQNFIAQIIVDPTQFAKMKSQLKYDNLFPQEGIFIIKVMEVVSRSPSIEYNEGSKESGPYISLDNIDGRLIILKGTLVDFYLNAQ